MAKVSTIPAKRLTKLQAVPRAGSVISPHRQEVADTLSPQRLGALMREADEGSPEAYFVLAEEMEEREPHLASVVFTRKLGVAGCPVLVEAHDDSEEAKELATAVEQLVAKPEFEGLVLDLMDAVMKGISLVEIVWQQEPEAWTPVRYEFRPQRLFVFDKDTMTVPLLRTDTEPEGVPLDPYKWIIHQPKLRSGIPIRTGIARTAAVAYAAKRWCVADWLAFLDIYGMPVRIGKYPAHQADKAPKLLKAVRALGSDAAAVIPAEMEVEVLEAKSGSGNQTLFESCAVYWDKQTSKLVLGQTMTTDDGSSLAQSKTHERVRMDILAADARALSATINRDLVKPFCDLNFGPQEAYPTVTIMVDEGEDVTAFMQNVKTYVDLGGRVQASEVRDRIGLAEPEPGAELLAPRQLPATEPPDGKRGPVGDTDGSDAEGDEPADEDDEIEGDGKSSEMNREQLARRAPGQEPYDATDEDLAERLAEWRPLLEGNVGRLIAELQDAESYDEARAKLEELARDEGEVLDVGALVVALSRGMFKLRGVGDATDEVKP